MVSASLGQKMAREYCGIIPPAVIRLRDERRRQNQLRQTDSGIGSSITDSESEQGSKAEINVCGKYYEGIETENTNNEASSTQQVESSDEDSVCDYGYMFDEDKIENDDFMKERQTSEDYSAYRETIFDFSPTRKEEENIRPLIEEIKVKNEDNSCEADGDEEAVRIEITEKDNNEEIEEKIDVNNQLIEEITQEDSNKEADSSTDISVTLEIRDSYEETKQNLDEDNEAIEECVDEDKSVLKMVTEELEKLNVLDSDNVVKELISSAEDNKVVLISSDGSSQLSDAKEIHEEKQVEIEDVIEEDEMKSNSPNEVEQILKEEIHKIVVEELQKLQTEEPEDKEETVVQLRETCDDELDTLVKIYANKTEETSSESESEDDESKPFYRKMDKAEITAYKEDLKVEERDGKNKEALANIKQNLEDIRELLDWNIDTNKESEVIPQFKNKRVEDSGYLESTDAYKLVVSALNKKEEPEFKVTEPASTVSETDIILYAKNIKDSISSVKQEQSSKNYKRCINEGDIATVKDPTVHRVLKMSSNITVMQSSQNISNPSKGNPVANEIREDNSIIAANSISNVRTSMREFRESLDEFNNRYKKQYADLIQNYNESCRKYTEKIDALCEVEYQENLKKLRKAREEDAKKKDVKTVCKLEETTCTLEKEVEGTKENEEKAELKTEQDREAYLEKTLQIFSLIEIVEHHEEYGVEKECFKDPAEQVFELNREEKQHEDPKEEESIQEATEEFFEAHEPEDTEKIPDQDEKTENGSEVFETPEGSEKGESLLQTEIQAPDQEEVCSFEECNVQEEQKEVVECTLEMQLAQDDQ